MALKHFLLRAACSHFQINQRRIVSKASNPRRAIPLLWVCPLCRQKLMKPGAIWGFLHWLHLTQNFPALVFAMTTDEMFCLFPGSFLFLLPEVKTISSVFLIFFAFFYSHYKNTDDFLRNIGMKNCVLALET